MERIWPNSSEYQFNSILTLKENTIMITYRLDIAFTNDQLETIAATNTRVIVAKPTSGDEPNVAWQTFNPFQDNSLMWTESYGIYASNTEITHGAQLQQLSNTPIGAATNMEYTLDNAGVIMGPVDGGSANSFTLINQYNNKDFITAGLFQDANVNGVEIIGNATSAAPVLLASTAVMTPFTTVYIWLQSNINGNTVITEVTSPMTRLTFGGGVNEISVNYNTASGRFLSVQG